MEKSPKEMTKEERMRIYVTEEFKQLISIFDDVKLTHKKELRELFDDIITICGFTQKAIDSFFTRQVVENSTVFQKMRSKQVEMSEHELLFEWNDEFMKKQRELFEKGQEEGNCRKAKNGGKDRLPESKR